MKTKVRQTSIDAYHSQNFTPLQIEIVKALRELKSSCIADIAAYLNMERSTVDARLNELKQMQALVFDGKKKSERTEIMSEFWRVRNFSESLF